MKTLQQNRQRGPRSIMGPAEWADNEKTVAYKELMVINDQADKTIADKWVEDANRLEGLAARLKSSAQHVFNGTRPIIAVKEADIPTDPDELRKLVLSLQRKVVKLSQKTAVS